MKNRFFKIILFLLFATDCYSQGVGARVGVGQFASQAEQIDGSTGNSGIIGLTLKSKRNFMLDLSVRINGTRQTEVDFKLLDSTFTIAHLWRRIGYTAVIMAPGFKVGFSQLIGGLEFFTMIGGGVSFATVLNRVQYSLPDATPVFKPYENHQNWKPIWIISAGFKVRVLFLGIFGEASYYDGAPLEYDAVKINDIMVIPGGEVQPRGFAAYIGLCWD